MAPEEAGIADEEVVRFMGDGVFEVDERDSPASIRLDARRRARRTRRACRPNERILDTTSLFAATGVGAEVVDTRGTGVEEGV
jgi:hypothetical protein